MENFKNTELIQKFFKGELNTEEQKQFNLDLKTDKALAEEFAFTKALKDALLLEEEAATKHRIEAYYKTKNSTQRTSYKKIWVAVVGFTILTGIVIWKIGNFGQSRLVRQVQRPLELSVVERLPINFNVTSELQQAYDNGDFRKANDLFKAMAEKALDFFPAVLFSGICHIYLQEEQDAIDLLNTIDLTTFPELEAEVALYLGIAHYQLKQTEKASAAWKKLEDTNKQIVKDIKKQLDEQLSK